MFAGFSFLRLVVSPIITVLKTARKSGNFRYHSANFENGIIFCFPVCIEMLIPLSSRMYCTQAPFGSEKRSFFKLRSLKSPCLDLPKPFIVASRNLANAVQSAPVLVLLGTLTIIISNDNLVGAFSTTDFEPGEKISYKRSHSQVLLLTDKSSLVINEHLWCF